jgi:hypothetical protein
MCHDPASRSTLIVCTTLQGAPASSMTAIELANEAMGALYG